MESNLCPGRSVGVLIPQGESWLMLRRTQSNIGLAAPAGHIDEGEESEQAARREVLEETGIVLGELKLVLHKEFPNPCKRGFTAHEWFVYEALAWSGEPVNKEPTKHEFVDFRTVAQIAEHAEAGDMDSAWRMILSEPEIGILK